MERESSHPSYRERTRYLNIVYFIESARSHTIRVNLTHARWVVGGAVVVFTWAIASIFWITSLRLEIMAARDRLETSLTTIFDYQIKNDQVFDIAYPADVTNSYYLESAQLPSNNPVVEKAIEKTSEKASDKVAPIAVTKAPDKLADKTPAKPDPQVNTPSAATADTVHSNDPADNTEASRETMDKLIDISNAKVSKTGSKYLLVFDINNLSKRKAEGYIWTVASFTTDSGQTSLSAAPEQTKIDSATGDITSIKSAYRFSIQRFKNKIFDIKTPAGKDWKLSAIKIHFSDVAGTSKDAINIPVDKVTTSATASQPEIH